MKFEGQSGLRWLGLSLGAAVFLVSALVARVYEAGTSALAHSEQAFDAGDLETATRAARVAANWYLPSAPHVQAAYGRLRAIAIGAETQGDTTAALRAWSALRAAIIETDHPWSAREQELREANEGVARLLQVQAAQREPAAWTHEEEEGRVQSAYRQPIGSGRTLFAVLTSVGMALMLWCGFSLSRAPHVASVAQVTWMRSGLLLGFGLWVLAALGA